MAGALLAGGVAASLLARRVRLPGLVLFLGLGMLVGSDGLGWINFNDYELAQTIGIIALALILYEGGLSAGFGEIRPVLRPALSLATVGTLITALITGYAASEIFDLPLLEGLLIGAVLSSTDGAAVFALLRGSTLRRRLARTLEGEAGFNDPVAVLLVLGFIEWLENPDYGVLDLLWKFVQEMTIGGVVGLAVGVGAVAVFRRARLETAGLYPVASVAAAALSYGAASVLHGSGFLAVYLAGLVLGTGQIPARATISAFHEGLAWVAQITMFLTLGILVFPSTLLDYWWQGTLLALIICFVARPVATFTSTAFQGFSVREQTLLGWAGLRGAVPVVLAIFPVIANVPHDDELFNIVFFAVVISTILQGVSFVPLATKLGVTTDEPALPKPLMETGTVRALGAEVVEYPVAEGDAIVGRRVRELGLPRDSLLNVIVRDGQALPPRGSSRIEAGDRLHVLVVKDVANEFQALLERWRHGPFDEIPRRRPAIYGRQVIFSTRPWDDDLGDPARPAAVAGVPVIERMRTRRDTRGALVALDDGRYAVTGPSLAVGSASDLQRYARRRLEKARSEAERGWWQEVIGAVAR
ncbi:K(+)/H(+) antiporter NhaP2 [Capillimicrobium parvum]|uniref:K(+)/H(+) antiporter NhaP2 n=1 Tax=Capillimicrobium parvum TaxID=2884022 RepID=A0A9E6Y2W0_9ACTN|nr:K(+)/H(+) antiporter NhaP2 [Capillimicrobium parvum]